MKAHINGITVEGTPEEIFDLMCRAGDAGSLRNTRQVDVGSTDHMTRSNNDHRKYEANTTCYAMPNCSN